MGEKGQVIELKANIAVVKMERTEACAKCRACEGLGKHEMVIEAKNLCDADVGDTVEIDLESQNFLKAIGIMYGIPLITLMLGFVIGYILIKNEFLSFALGIIFMLLTYLWIKQKEPYWKKQNFSPRAIKKL